MNGRGCRRKGHTWERDVVALLAPIFGADRVRRGLQYRDGADCPDVIAPAFWIEAKVGRLTNPRAALRQAIEASAGKGVWPIAITKDDRTEPVVTMALSDFLDLLKEWWERRQQ